jgi:hypothetical protein
LKHGSIIAAHFKYGTCTAYNCFFVRPTQTSSLFQTGAQLDPPSFFKGFIDKEKDTANHLQVLSMQKTENTALVI